MAGTDAKARRTTSFARTQRPNVKTPAVHPRNPLPATPAVMQSTLHSLSAVTLSSTPETQEVEVFELQHRPLTSVSSSANAPATEWQPHLFTPSPYDPLSPARIAGDRPRGTRFFEDVAPPEGWEWASKKWELDLEAGEWVNERLVVGVEYDVLHHHSDDDDLDDDDNDDAIDSNSVNEDLDLRSPPENLLAPQIKLQPAPTPACERELGLWRMGVGSAAGTRQRIEPRRRPVAGVRGLRAPQAGSGGRTREGTQHGCGCGREEEREGTQ